MVTGNVTISPTLIELRHQAHYWKAQHARAIKREGLLKEKVLRLKRRSSTQKTKILEQKLQIEKLKAHLAWLQQQVFGRKTEETKPPSAESLDHAESSNSKPSGSSSGEKRKRGKQPGTKGYGRRRRKNLPKEETVHDLPQEDQRCSCCGKPFVIFPGTEDSEEIDWEVRLFRRVHKRRRYRPTCNCRAVPGIVTATLPAKLIPKSMFSNRFWLRLLMEKFLFQRPLYRIRQMLEMEGLDISQGTLTGGLCRIKALLQPLYAGIIQHSQAAKHWHMDETRWFVFAKTEVKTNHRWWLWVVVTHDTCCYILDPFRSSNVPKSHLGEKACGIISADRYTVYKSLGENIQVAFCWSHVRRDFIRIRQGYKRLRRWGEDWVKRIDHLFRLNAGRLAASSDVKTFSHKDTQLANALACMAQRRDRELAKASLHPVQRKVLKSLANHWDGLTIFRERHDIPMDNNEAERCLRNPVVGRKNYYGSGSVWSGQLSATLFTIFQTLLTNRLSPIKFLSAYFQACAYNRGQPPKNIDGFLPWNLSTEQKVAWCYSGPSP